jgi:hypothetical protein
VIAAEGRTLAPELADDRDEVIVRPKLSAASLWIVPSRCNALVALRRARDLEAGVSPPARTGT